MGKLAGDDTDPSEDDKCEMNNEVEGHTKEEMEMSV